MRECFNKIQSEFYRFSSISSALVSLINHDSPEEIVILGNLRCFWIIAHFTIIIGNKKKTDWFFVIINTKWIDRSFGFITGIGMKHTPYIISNKSLLVSSCF